MISLDGHIQGEIVQPFLLAPAKGTKLFLQFGLLPEIIERLCERFRAKFLRVVKIDTSI